MYWLIFLGEEQKDTGLFAEVDFDLDRVGTQTTSSQGAHYVSLDSNDAQFFGTVKLRYRFTLTLFIIRTLPKKRGVWMRWGLMLSMTALILRSAGCRQLVPNTQRQPTCVVLGPASTACRLTVASCTSSFLARVLILPKLRKQDQILVSLRWSSFI